MTSPPRTPSPEPRSLCDRLRDAGVADTARALTLVEEMRKRDAEGLECRDWYLCFKSL